MVHDPASEFYSEKPSQTSSTTSRSATSPSKMNAWKIFVVIAVLIAAVVGLFFFGQFLGRQTHSPASSSSVYQSLQDSIDPEKIKANLRRLTKEPHLAGTPENERVSEAIMDMWKSAGIQDVHTIEYETLLSYPVYEKPNRMFIHSKEGKEIFSTSGISPPIIEEEQSDKRAGHQWLAYSASGRVTGDVVYAHIGTPAEFKILKERGIDVNGKIVMMRYNSGFRAEKVHFAQVNGAIGVILYSDPSEVALDGTRPEDVYPNTVWMPPDAVQRGTLKHESGDPLTPLYPSKKGLFKDRTIEDALNEGVLPRIPVLPISYGSAYEIFKRMNGDVVPENWKGNLSTTYRFGPGLVDDAKITIDVHSTLQTKKIQNVVGYIGGSVEPDRYVILGNHYDAWAYGSLDPNSGTAVMAEVARAMMKTVNETGWRPARTIMFVAWDAEEYGLIGSSEFVEEFTNILQQRAVVYLNLDSLVGNYTFEAAAFPSVKEVIMKAIKNVKNPNKDEVAAGRTTVYDTWVNRTVTHKMFKKAVIVPPIGGSDHVPFMSYAGVPVVYFSYRGPHPRIYPLYHTMYETPFLNEKLMDTDNFAIHRATGQVWAEMARIFADEPILPINATDMANSLANVYLPMMTKKVAATNKNIPKPLLQALEPAKRQFAELNKVAQSFVAYSQKFEKKLSEERQEVQQNGQFSRKIQAANERLMNLEKCFLNPRGIPGAPSSRHVLFSISGNDQYKGIVMAGVFEAFQNFKSASPNADFVQLGREIANQLSIVQYSVHCAISTLKEHI